MSTSFVKSRTAPNIQDGRGENEASGKTTNASATFSADRFTSRRQANVEVVLVAQPWLWPQIGGETIIIARNGSPISELRPLGRVSSTETVKRIRAISLRVAKRNEGKKARPPDGASLCDIAFIGTAWNTALVADVSIAAAEEELAFVQATMQPFVRTRLPVLRGDSFHVGFQEGTIICDDRE